MAHRIIETEIKSDNNGILRFGVEVDISHKYGLVKGDLVKKDFSPLREEAALTLGIPKKEDPAGLVEDGSVKEETAEDTAERKPCDPEADPLAVPFGPCTVMS